MIMPRAHERASALLRILKTKRPATTVRRGSTSHFVSSVASVSRTVSPTVQTQPRDSRTTAPH